MKKIIISVLALSAMGMSGVVAAASGDVQFIGAVTATTCDLTPEVGGAVTNMVQLGTASTSAAATPVHFTLKADNSQGCNALTSNDIAEISWGGPFNATGLSNQGGTATDAWVKLSSVNAKTTNIVDMTASRLTVDFAGDTLNTDGAKFSAELNGGTIPGNYSSAAAFVVAYK